MFTLHFIVKEMTVKHFKTNYMLIQKNFNKQEKKRKRLFESHNAEE